VPSRESAGDPLPTPSIMVRALDRLTAGIGCALVLALLACVALGVVTRALGAPLAWTDEGSRFLMVWLAVFGWVLASRKRIHVRIRYFQGLLPRAWHDGVEVVIQLALVVFGVLVAGYAVVLVVRNADLDATSLPISIAWMYVPMVLAGAVAAVQAIVELVEAARGRRRPPGSPLSRDEAAG
jgi:TRAP-type transport system small permease protein